MQSRKRKKSELPVRGSQPEEMYGLATRKNMFLDRPTSHGGWPEGEYDPPVNDRIYNYLRSMGLMTNEDIRYYVRQILLELKTDEELDSDILPLSSTVVNSGGFEKLTDEFVKRVIDPITGDYRTNPVVRRETDAVLSVMDDWATRISIGLGAIGIGVGLIGTAPVSIPTGLLAASAAAGLFNNATQATAALVRGDKAAAGTHILLAALDAAIGGRSEAIAQSLGRRAGASAAASHRSTQAAVSARKLGLRPDQIAPSNPAQARMIRRAAGSASATGKFYAATAGSAAAAGIFGSLEIIGNELVARAQEYDDKRRESGVSPDATLTQPTREMAARLKSGNINPQDASMIADSLTRMEVIKPTEEQTVYEMLLNKSLGIDQSFDDDM